MAGVVSKKGAIETAVVEIYLVVKKSSELFDSSEEWPVLNKLIGSKLDEVQTFADDFRGIDESVQGMEKDLATMAMVNLRGGQTIYNDILAKFLPFHSGFLNSYDFVIFKGISRRTSK